MPLRSRLIAPLLPLLLIASLATAEPRRHAASPPVAETSESLIADALQRGEIDADTALMYGIFADFGDPRLPAQFRGTVTSDFDSTSAAEAVARWDSLSPSVQQAIAPFLIPPFQKGSWADQQSPLRASSVHANDIALCGDVDTKNWDSVASISGTVRVWWMRIHPEDQQVALALAGKSETILGQYRALLGREPIKDNGSVFPCRGGDDAIDVTLADVNHSSTIPFGVRSTSSFVVLERNAADGPEATLAHELFHVMQFTYNVSDYVVALDYHWLMEATAQWAMDYHQRPGNSGREQRAASLWLDEPDKSLTLEKKGQYHEYGGYLFFLYLSRTYGDSIIKTIWDATESHDAVTAVDSSIPGGFKERWPEFAADAWNHAPLDKFNQWDQLTLTPATQSGTLLSGQPDFYLGVYANLPRLSARYVYVTLDSTVHSLAFLNGLTYDLGTIDPTPGPFNYGPLYQWNDASDDAKRGAFVQIMVKKNGQWQAPEDLSNMKIKAFCQDNPSEKIDELVLILTNSDTDEKRTLKSPDLDSQLIVTNIGCGQFTGTNSFTSNDAAFGRVGHLSEEFDVTYSRDDNKPVSDTQPAYRFNISGHASYTVSGKNPTQPCEYKGHADSVPLLTSIDAYTYNFVPQASAVYRKAILPAGLAQPAKFQVVCAGVDPIDEDAGAIGGLFPPFTDNHLYFMQLEPDGTLSGEVPDQFGTWKWNIKPQ